MIDFKANLYGLTALSDFKADLYGLTALSISVYSGDLLTQWPAEIGSFSNFEMQKSEI